MTMEESVKINAMLDEIRILKMELNFDGYYNAFLLGMLSTKDFEKISRRYFMDGICS